MFPGQEARSVTIRVGSQATRGNVTEIDRELALDCTVVIVGRRRAVLAVRDRLLQAGTTDLQGFIEHGHDEDRLTLWRGNRPSAAVAHFTNEVRRRRG